jgi:hypothetical protein
MGTLLGLPSLGDGQPMRGFAHTNLTAALFIGLLTVTACNLPSRRVRRTNLPHGNHVEYRHGAKILTQRFVERDELHYYLSDLKIKPPLFIRGKTETNHSFEIGSTASCKLSAPPPQKLVFELIHEVAKRNDSHFPPPRASKGLTEQNASFDIIVLADGQTINIPGHYQSELKKDLPTDATYYEVLITEISREDFVRMANAKAVKIQLRSFGSFDLDQKTIDVLKFYSDTVSDTEIYTE